MKQIFRLFMLTSLFLPAFAFCREYQVPGGETGQGFRVKIGFIAPLPYSGSTAEIKAAFDFLQNEKNFDNGYLTFAEIRKHPGILKDYDILWFHKPDTSAFSTAETEPKALKALKDYLDGGGNLFLTLEAFRYILPLGLENLSPKDSIKSSIDDGYGRKLGFHAYLDHPVFAGMFGGAYIWRPVNDLKTRITGYFGESTTINGHVIGVDWDYIFLRDDSKLLIEYKTGKGKVIACGGYTWYSEPNFNKAHLEMFTRNVLSYLASKENTGDEHYWDYSPTIVSECPPKVQDADIPFPSIPKSIPWSIHPDTLLLFRQPGTSNYWDVAGERILTMGKENGGIEEIWSHPFMALRDYEAGVRTGDRDTIFWLNGLVPEIEVSGTGFTRKYILRNATLLEVVVNDPSEAAAVIHYEYSGEARAEIILRFKSNLRLMWPYSEKAVRSVCYGWDEDYHAFIVRDPKGTSGVMIGSNRKPVEKLGGHFSSIIYDDSKKTFSGVPSDVLEFAGLLVYQLEKKDELDAVITASWQNDRDLIKQYDKSICNPFLVWERSDSACREMTEERLVITTPDRNFNKGYLWSLIATNRFFVNTPGMGKSLVAGYSTTQRGWDGGHKVNGRPGYGWYFGRDGQWSGFALLDYGDFEKVRSELEFYNKYQDLSGKIYHEATTSGVIHYDAADATPLYIVLAGRYFRHSNDTAFLRQTWPSVKKAIDFCFSTDTDRDHLIENTNVGHGWVEGGELYGSHATLYLNSCWEEALGEAFNMSKALDRPDAESYKLEAGNIRRIINSEFWNKQDSFYFYGKNRDGSFRPEPTILPAVPLSFRHGDQGKAKMVLQQYASNVFSTNWGSRIIRDDSKLFNPKGYHYGSVWPLFTGWTAMAEYAYGNYQQGYMHLVNNLNVYKYWGLGFVEEVLNGSEYLESGVCPHQCWSETMVLQPAIEGLLGLDIRAQENKVILAPHLPADWDSLVVTNIRIGGQVFDFRYRRTGSRYTFEFLPVRVSKINIEFLPTFPAGTILKKASLNGTDAQIASMKTPQYTTLVSKFTLESDTKLDFGVENGISVLPVTTDPKPGDPAAGLRLISAKLSGNQYAIEMEGIPGRSGVIRVYQNQKISKVENGKVIAEKGKILEIQVDFENADGLYVRKVVNVILL